jgi:hypothetical protein
VNFAGQAFGVHQKNPGNHAKQIRRIVDNCIMQKHTDIGEE